MGKKKQPFYRIVAIDSRSARNGRYLENLGTYDPVKNPAEVSVNEDRALYWLGQGAVPSDTVRSFLKRKGVLLKWHLIQQGADDAAIADEVQKWEAQQAEHEKRRDALTEQKKRDEAKEAQAAAEAEAKAEADAEVKAKAAADAEAKAQAAAEAATAEAEAEDVDAKADAPADKEAGEVKETETKEETSVEAAADSGDAETKDSKEDTPDDGEKAQEGGSKERTE